MTKPKPWWYALQAILVSAFAAFAILMLVVALVGILYPIFSGEPPGYRSGPELGHLMVPIYVIAFLLSLAFIYMVEISGVLFGWKMDVTTERAEYRPGDVVRARMDVRSRNQINCREFTATLCCEEWLHVSCTKGKRNVRIVQMHGIYSEKKAVSRPGPMHPGQYGAEFTIPTDCIPTIRPGKDSDVQDEFQEGAGVRWFVEAKLNIINAPDINERTYISVE